MRNLKRDDVSLISFELNGRQVSGTVQPRTLLSDFLRGTVGATGTHVGCEHGVCGCCTVTVDGIAQRSCLTLAIQAEGRSVGTVEGLAEQNAGELNALQRAFNKHHALQCGFCTPGILMSFTDFLSRNPDPDIEQVKEVLGGHICRCTGYDGLVKAIMEAAGEIRETCVSTAAE